MYLAGSLNEARHTRITAVLSNAYTVDLTDSTADLYNGALAQFGSQIKAVTDYDGALFKVTTEAAFNPAPTPADATHGGDYLHIAWWRSKKRGMAFWAIQEAVRLSYPWWFRETFVLDAAATITLASGTYTYALPTDVKELFRVGIDDGSGNIRWTAPENVWRVTGEPGALNVRFYTGMRGGNFADTYSGDKLCLHYAAAEPVPTAETDSVELPIEYFRVAAALYDERLLRSATDSDLRRLSVALPQEQGNARDALAHLGLVKQRPPMPLFGILDS